PEPYTLSLHDALPISPRPPMRVGGVDGESGRRRWADGRHRPRVRALVDAVSAAVRRVRRSASHSRGVGRATDLKVPRTVARPTRSEEHTSELQSLAYL